MMRRVRKSLLAASFVSCVALVLVARGQPSSAGPAPAVKAGRGPRALRGPGGPAAQRDAAEGAAVLARFEGGSITVRDFQDALANKAPLARKQLASPEGRQRFLRDLVRYELLLREAERRGYQQNQAVLDAITNASIDQMILRDLTPPAASIPAEDVARHFAEKRARYMRPVTRRASQIQVGTEAEARALIAELATADAARFARAAVEHSTDPHTHDQGGELGYVTRDGHRSDGTLVRGLAPEVLRAVFEAQRPGVLPAPVRHAGGFSVVLFVGEMPALEPTLASVEGTLREELAGARQAEALAALTAKLRAEVKPAVRAALVDDVVPDTTPLGVPAGFPAAPEDPRAPTIVAEDDGV